MKSFRQQKAHAGAGATKPTGGVSKKAAAAEAAAKLAEPEPEDVAIAVKVELDDDGEAVLPEPEEPDAAQPKRGKKRTTVAEPLDDPPKPATASKRRKTTKS